MLTHLPSRSGTLAPMAGHRSQENSEIRSGSTVVSPKKNLHPISVRGNFGKENIAPTCTHSQESATASLRHIDQKDFSASLSQKRGRAVASFGSNNSSLFTQNAPKISTPANAHFENIGIAKNSRIMPAQRPETLANATFHFGYTENLRIAPVIKPETPAEVCFQSSIADYSQPMRTPKPATSSNIRHPAPATPGSSEQVITFKKSVLRLQDSLKNQLVLQQMDIFDDSTVDALEMLVKQMRVTYKTHSNLVNSLAETLHVRLDRESLKSAIESDRDQDRDNALAGQSNPQPRETPTGAKFGSMLSLKISSSPTSVKPCPSTKISALQSPIVDNKYTGPSAAQNHPVPSSSRHSVASLPTRYDVALSPARYDVVSSPSRYDVVPSPDRPPRPTLLNTTAGPPCAQRKSSPFSQSARHGNNSVPFVGSFQPRKDLATPVLLPSFAPRGIKRNSIRDHAIDNNLLENGKAVKARLSLHINAESQKDFGIVDFCLLPGNCFSGQSQRLLGLGESNESIVLELSTSAILIETNDEGSFDEQRCLILRNKKDPQTYYSVFCPSPAVATSLSNACKPNGFFK